MTGRWQQAVRNEAYSENFEQSAIESMNQEFDLAYNLARSGYKWQKYPPGFEPATKPP